MTTVIGRAAGRSTSRALVLIALGVGCAFLAWTLLWPGSQYASWVVLHTTQWLYDHGAPGSVVSDRRVEFALNAAMVTPIVLLATVLWPRWGWERWTAYAFVVSCAVEVVQALWLPERSAQFADVVANTLGAGVGAILGQLLVVLTRRHRRSATVSSRTGQGYLGSDTLGGDDGTTSRRSVGPDPGH